MKGNAQLFAASSLPLTKFSGWNSPRYGPARTSSMTLGSRSMYSERGTCLPELVSEKNVLKPLSVADGESSARRPSGYVCHPHIRAFVDESTKDQSHSAKKTSREGIKRDRCVFIKAARDKEERQFRTRFAARRVEYQEERTVRPCSTV